MTGPFAATVPPPSKDCVGTPPEGAEGEPDSGPEQGQTHIT